MQTTIAKEIEFEGQGLHTGLPVTVSMLPAGQGYGIVFKRTDVRRCDNLVHARQEFVSETILCTKIENRSGVSVQTIEHLMAGLAACGVHNAVIDIDGPEVPIMDGSAVEFVRKILGTGVVGLGAPVRVLKILKRVEAKCGSARAILEPCDNFEMAFSISFPEPVGEQTKKTTLSNGNIVRDLVDCRTFCSCEDIEQILSMGRGLGGTSENVLLYSRDLLKYFSRPRHLDECVRHKMLDAIGDLALSGSPILGRFVGIRSGHAITNALLRNLFKSPDSYEMVYADEQMASVLPGVGAKLSDIPTVH